MNFSNPTQIKIGMTATISAKRYRVVGRAVLGETEGWRTYYWNEYNLAGDDGQFATLVFEETEDGPEWRFFTMFEPQFPITAEDAATKQTGQMINLDGENCYVSQKSRSRVYFVEGQPPEGEAVGTTADYFNATRGPKMLVVSWTGDEVECYRGITVPSGVVAVAFNLKKVALLKFQVAHGTKHLQANAVMIFGLLIFFALLIFLIASDAMPPKRLPAVKTYNPPPTMLEVEDAVTLDGKKYRVVRHRLVEIAEPGQKVQRHEFTLAGDDGKELLLVHGVQPGSDDWVWYTALTPSDPLTPQRAATVKAGMIVNVDGVVAAVTDLFRSKVLLDDWTGPLTTTGEIRYGFQGRQNVTLLLVRWNANEIGFYKGTTLSDREVKEAFGKAPPK